MLREQQRLRDTSNELEELKKRKENLKKALLEHRSIDLTDEQKAKVDKEAKTKERELDKAIEQKAAELEKLTRQQKNNQKMEESKMLKREYVNFQEGMELREVVETKEYRDAWLKNLQGRKNKMNQGERRAFDAMVTQVRAMDTTNNVAVMPTITLDLIMGKLTVDSMLDLVTIHNVPNWLSVPIEDLVNPAQWIAEGAAATPQNDTTRNINLVANKLMRAIQVTKEARTLSINAFEAWIVDRMVKKMKQAIEMAITNGTGTGQPQGFVTGVTWNATNQIEVTAMNALTYDNLVDLDALLDENYMPDRVYVMNRQSLAAIRKVKDDNGRPIFMSMVKNGFEGEIFGVRVKLNRYLPNGIYVADWKSAWVGNWISAIEFAMSLEVAFLAGDITYRALALFDGRPTLIPGAIARISVAAGTGGGTGG